MLLTSIGGAALVVAAWFILTGQVPTEDITWYRIGSLIADSFLWAIVWIAIAVAGMLAQLQGPAFGPDTYELDQTKYRYA